MGSDSQSSLLVQPSTEPTPANSAFLASGRLRALVALGVLVSAAAVLFLDMVNSTRIIPIDDQFGRAEPRIQVHLTLMGSNQLLDATPTLVFAPISWWNVDVQPEGLATDVNAYCVEDVLVASQAFYVGMFWIVKAGSSYPDEIIDATPFELVQEQYPVDDCPPSKGESGSTVLDTTYSTPQQNQDDFPIEWRSSNGASLFPFDTWYSATAISALTNADGATARLVAPGITVSSFANNWDVSANLLIENDNHPIVQNATNLYLTIRRPLSVRLFTVFLLLAILGLEAAIYFITDHNTAIGAVIGVIFGLWSIHELLVPPGMPAVNLVRSVILFLYVVLVVVAFLRFFAKPLLQAPDDASVGRTASSPDTGELTVHPTMENDDHRTD